MMTAYHCIWIALALGLVVSGTAPDFWEDTQIFNCGVVKDKLEANEDITDTQHLMKCIFLCFDATTEDFFEATPTQCFDYLVKPYITKVLKKTLPSETKMQECLAAEDRSDCKDTLLYFFSKWYKDHYTADHGKRFAKFIFYSWAENPDVKTTAVGFDFWDHYIGRDLSIIGFDTDQAIQTAIKITSPSDRSQFSVIDNEIKRHCYKPTTEQDRREFCRLRIIMNIARKIRTLAKGKQEYGEDFQKYVKALKSNFVPFSVLFHETKAVDISPPTTKEKTKVLDERLNDLVVLTRAGDTKKLQTFLRFMPETYLLDKACKQTDFLVVGRRSCILSEVVGQLLIYCEMAEKRKQPSTTKAVTINFSLNLRAVITELRGEELFKMMLDNRYQEDASQQEIAKLIEGKFDQLKNYFVKLQSFNMQKANADVIYVKGRIKYYEGKLSKAVEAVKTHVGGILRAAVITQGLDVGEKALKLAAAIAQACNPFDLVFNGGSATDIMDAAAELMKAISGLTHAIALRSAWKEVIDTVVTITTGFKTNSEFLSAVGRIVDKIKLTDFPKDDEFKQCKSTFLTLYNEYTPQVDKQMLATLTTKIDTSVDSGCSLINDASGSAASGYVAYVKKNLFCQKASVSTSSLQAVFEEIYDFQFEFIENMATYLRSATGYQASKEMVTITGRPIPESDNADERRNELKANIIMAHTTYEMQKQGALRSLCDFLEYKEGKTPAVCKETSIDVPTLLSYIPKRCRSVDSYVSIPITASHNAQPGYIDIKKLYSGEEVSFTIPSYEWLKEKKWLTSDENVEAVYIRSFQIFLPTIVSGKERLEVTVKSMGSNRFTDGGIRYSLVPAESFSNIYSGGKRFYPCNKNKMENPYSICEDRQLPKLCVLSAVQAFDDAKRLYPSVLSLFKIKAKGITPAQTPDPQTPLDLKASVNMCVFDSGPLRKKRATAGAKPGCCTGNDYWNEANNACETCATGSTATLNGYYCEKNKQALSEKKKRKKKKKESSLS